MSFGVVTSMKERRRYGAYIEKKRFMTMTTKMRAIKRHIDCELLVFFLFFPRKASWSASNNDTIELTMLMIIKSRFTIIGINI